MIRLQSMYKTFYFLFTNYLYHLIIIFKKNIKLGKNCFFKGFSYIYISKNSNLALGKNVVINSSNIRYHINMFRGCKIYADSENAKIIIGDQTRIHGTCIHAQKRIEIGKRCLVAANCQIIDSNGHKLSMEEPKERINSIGAAEEILIGDDVWIGANCTILSGTQIGSGSVVSVGSVVKGIFPSKSLIAGNPAKIIKRYE